MGWVPIIFRHGSICWWKTMVMIGLGGWHLSHYYLNLYTNLQNASFTSVTATDGMQHIDRYDRCWLQIFKCQRVNTSRVSPILKVKVTTPPLTTPRHQCPPPDTMPLVPDKDTLPYITKHWTELTFLNNNACSHLNSTQCILIFENKDGI